MADAQGAHLPVGDSIAVDFPVVLTFDHPELTLQGMFQFAGALDEYELQGDPINGRPVKERISVDVVDVTPTRTTIRVTPMKRLAYLDLAAIVDAMIHRVTSGIINGRVALVRMTWEIEAPGVASDERRTRGRIR
ncbi:MAG: hypothetical protein HYT80_07350 [Euryarchaeota archaeon]|nr:hypothetical protein [Euryarchaeota archaeon]